VSEATPDRRLKPTDIPGLYRKGNRYVVRWRHRGRQRERSFRTLTEAKTFKAQTVSGDAAPTSNQTLVTYAAGWLDAYTGRTSNGLRESTRASYRDVIDRVIVAYFKREAPTLKLRGRQACRPAPVHRAPCQRRARPGHGAPLLRPAAGHAGDRLGGRADRRQSRCGPARDRPRRTSAQAQAALA